MALTVGELQVILEAQTKNFQAGFDSAQKTVDRFSKESTRSIDSFSRGVSAALGGLATLIGAISFQRLVTGLLDVAEASREARQTLQVATGSVEEAEVVFGALAEVATNTRQSITGTVAVFDKLEQGTQDLGLSTKELVDLTETLNNTLLLSGTTGERAGRALNAFVNSFATGKVDVAAFNAALRQAPELSDAIAKGLGLTQKELLDLAKAGNLTADQLVKALQRISPEVAAQAAQLGPTFEQALQGIRNEIFLVVDAFTNAGGAGGAFAKRLDSLGKGLAENLVSGLRTAINGIAFLIDAFGDLSKVFELIGIDFTSLSLSLKILGDTGIIVLEGLKTGFQTLRVSVLTVIAAFKAAGNLVGLVSDEALQSSLDSVTKATDDLVAQATTSGAKIEAAFGRIGTALGGIFDAKRVEDNSVSNALKGLADDMRQAADEAVVAVDKVRTARSRLSTTPRGDGSGAFTQTADQAAEEKRFFERLKRQQEISNRLDEDFRKQRDKRLLDEAEAAQKRVAAFSDEIGTSVAGALEQGLQNGSAGFLSGFADSLAASAQEGLQRAFADSVADFTEGLTSALADIAPQIAGIFGGGPGGEPTLGGQLLGSAFQIGGAALTSLASAALRDDEIKASAGSVQSAVTSAQQVRGLVAGPTQIAIADVARGINDAFQEPTRLLGLIARNTALTAARVGGGGGTEDDEAAALLSNQSESLI